ncbi:DUF2267 domain-containing protein [Methylocapsa aurea]|uniref:DUF2267 domain-containing protein n=1 Tax=Methylocapsa aurea TaxID=663610 RepID=UPI00055CB9A6|nr:DUF2267 domain-containing protein [Methylocapsa aurea]
MTKRSLRELDGAVRAATDWIDDLTLRLGWQDRDKVYLALIAALHALRDWLPRDEAIYIGACFPPLLRGLYYEGWRGAGHPPAKSRGAFLARIHDGVHREPGVDAEQVAQAVLALLTARLPPAEIENAKAATPKELHGLWPS